MIFFHPIDRLDIPTFIRRQPADRMVDFLAIFNRVVDMLLWR